jgi:hypothetical protein
MAFKGQIKIYVGWEWDDGAADNANISYNESLADGVGVNQAEAVYHVDSIELLDGNNTTYDLTALVRQVQGDPTHLTSFLTVKCIAFINESTAGELVVGAAAANEWSEPFGADGDTVIVPADSPVLLASRRCGHEIDDTNKNLKVAAQGGDVTYSMAIIGTLNSATGECSSSA